MEPCRKKLEIWKVQIDLSVAFTWAWLACAIDGSAPVAVRTGITRNIPTSSKLVEITWISAENKSPVSRGISA